CVICGAGGGAGARASTVQNGSPAFTDVSALWRSAAHAGHSIAGTDTISRSAYTMRAAAASGNSGAPAGSAPCQAATSRPTTELCGCYYYLWDGAQGRGY